MTVTGWLSPERTHIIIDRKHFGSWKDAIAYESYLTEQALSQALIESVVIL